MSGIIAVRMILCATILLVGFGCARSPEAQKARHLAHGDAYFGKARYREAIIEYQNVLRFDSSNRRSVAQLGLSHYRLGEVTPALRYLARAEQLDPDDLEVQTSLATLYLLGGQPSEARRRAASILAKERRHFQGLLLFAQSAATPDDVRAATQRLEGARSDFDQRPAFHLALGALYLRQQDPGAAKNAFETAIARDPKSVEAYEALGDFYLRRRDQARAELEFTRAAALAPSPSAAQIRLATFYVNTGRANDAKRILNGIVTKTPEYVPAWNQIAEIALTEGKYNDSLSALEKAMKKNSSDLTAHFLKGRVYLAKHETTRAIQEFQTVLKAEPAFIQARYQLALADVESGNLEQAKMELKEATKDTPNFSEARLLLGTLYLRTGALPSAITELEAVVAQQPTLLQARTLLGAAYLAKREPTKATEVFQKLASLAPREPQGPYLVGLGLLSQGQRREAEKHFEKALMLRADYSEPLAQLVALDLADKRPDLAVERVKRQIGLAPTSASLQFLLGGVYRAQGQTRPAEIAYLKAVELEPHQTGPYIALGQLYATSGNYEAALAKLNDALAVQAKDIAALMLRAVLYDQRGDSAKAQQGYEQVLALNPRFAPAANNLAYLYSQTGQDKERALQLARKAKELRPDDPHISDTLAWILYQRGVYQEAFNLLKQSVTKVPDNPEIQYHLGMAAYRIGDKKTAATALTHATRSSRNFAGKDEAKRTLDML